MKWSQDHEECLQVIAKILIRQLGLPEKTLILTDNFEWDKLHAAYKYKLEDLDAACDKGSFHVWVNVDLASNFYDVVMGLIHELFHLKRPKVIDEYRINNWGVKWLNNNIIKQVNLAKL